MSTFPYSNGRDVVFYGGASTTREQVYQAAVARGFCENAAVLEALRAKRPPTAAEVQAALNALLAEPKNPSISPDSC